MFHLVRPIVFDAFSLLNSICKSHMFPLLAILALGNAKIHVHSLYYSDITSYIERSVNDYFSRETAL